MSKVFVIAGQDGQSSTTLQTALEIADALALTPKVYAYGHAYFSGAEYYNPRLAGAARQKILACLNDELTAILSELQRPDVAHEAVWSKRLHEHALPCAASEGYSMMIKGIEGAESPEPEDWQLIRHTKVPLMLLTANPLARGRLVLMAVDLDATSEDKKLLNRLVLERGRHLANALNLPLHLACVVRVPQVLRELDITTPHEILIAAHEKHRDTLSQFDLPTEQIHLVTGDPAQCLYQLSSSLKAKYLVIGARQREGIFGATIGSTAEQLIHKVRCNLLILPPDPQWLGPCHD
ncbi:universal stress protein [Shewanella litorisediminis]|uniref:Universal stress protein n=1 Tax=Shewanella litorisediminis TaxID=1173586 RepID=A0ABX7G507_9GAMM|nr:universal stress protein [Shewanella litorisediminis]MCL2917918.1 universal stress protein [Shewanella litorisediminis]QRH02353.1 universal stress protein [Shewanella litorisediminis]